jgi:hypothetical protein
MYISATSSAAMQQPSWHRTLNTHMNRRKLLDVEQQMIRKLFSSLQTIDRDLTQQSRVPSRRTSGLVGWPSPGLGASQSTGRPWCDLNTRPASARAAEDASVDANGPTAATTTLQRMIVKLARSSSAVTYVRRDPLSIPIASLLGMSSTCMSCQGNDGL